MSVKVNTLLRAMIFNVVVIGLLPAILYAITNWRFSFIGMGVKSPSIYGLTDLRNLSDLILPVVKYFFISIFFTDILIYAFGVFSIILGAFPLIPFAYWALKKDVFGLKGWIYFFAASYLFLPLCFFVGNRFPFGDYLRSEIVFGYIYWIVIFVFYRLLVLRVNWNISLRWGEIFYDFGFNLMFMVIFPLVVAFFLYILLNPFIGREVISFFRKFSLMMAIFSIFYSVIFFIFLWSEIILVFLPVAIIFIPLSSWKKLEKKEWGYFCFMSFFMGYFIYYDISVGDLLDNPIYSCFFSLFPIFYWFLVFFIFKFLKKENKVKRLR